MAVQEIVVRVKGTRRAVRQFLGTLPSAIANSDSPAAQLLLTKIGLSALGKISEAFIAKSEGGSDDTGLRWKPLQPSTIARRNRRPGTPESRPSSALSQTQRRRWWAIYAHSLPRFGYDKARAAALAWLILKANGAPSHLALQGQSHASILNATGDLLLSLTPTIEPSDATTSTPPLNPFSVFRVERGSVTIGTTRKGAIYHHYGVPGRLPQRPLWPEPSQWPARWWEDILSDAAEGVAQVIVELLKR